MGKGSQTTTSNQSYTPNPQAMQLYQQLLTQAAGVAATPYQAYTGQLVAPINQQETTGIGGINNYSQFALPAVSSALGLAQGAAAPITAGQIQQYMSPYTQSVVNATQNQFNTQNAQQQQQILGNAIAQGAMGGNRVGLTQAAVAGQQQQAQAPVIANLENQGYQTGLNTALTEQQAALQAAYGLAGIGTGGQSSLLSGAGQQLGAGQLQQQTQQAQNTAAYQQFQQQMAYPFQTTQWLASLAGAIGPNMGGSGTSSTTSPGPSELSQMLGLGTAAAGAIPYILPMLSDERAKENIKAIGKLKDGQMVYRFNYKGDPATHIGLLAQEVEKKHPGAVHKEDGIRFVDYDKATRAAASRWSGGPVLNRDLGGATMGMEAPQAGVAGAPYGMGAYSTPSSYVPGSQLTPASPFTWRLPAPPQAPGQQQGGDPSKIGQQVGQLAGNIFQGLQNQGPLNISTGGFSPTGAGVDMATNFSPAALDILGAGPYARGGGVRGYDDGGGVDYSDLPPEVAAQLKRAASDPNYAASLDSSLGISQNPNALPQVPVVSPFGSNPRGSIDANGRVTGMRRGGWVRGYDDGGGVDVEDPSVNIPPDHIPDTPPVQLASASTNPPTASLGDASIPLPPPRPATADQPLRLASALPPQATGVVPSSSYSAPTSDDLQNRITAAMPALGGMESGNRYDALGPVVKTASGPDRAYGRYQVMGANIPSWTKEVLGQSLTPQQFLNSSEAQDAVFRAKFGQYASQYGLEGAARAWEGGPGGVNRPNAVAHDLNGNPIGLPVGDYGQQFMSRIRNMLPTGLAASSGVAGPAAGPNGSVGPGTSAGWQGVAAPVMGTLQKVFPNLDLSPQSKLFPSLIAAGAAMMASRSPFPGVAIGQGIQSGLGEYQQLRSAETATALKQQELGQNAAKLQSEANHWAADYEIKLETMKQNQAKENREAQKPVSLPGMFGNTTVVWNPQTGRYENYDPMSTPEATPANPLPTPNLPTPTLSTPGTAPSPPQPVPTPPPGAGAQPSAPTPAVPQAAPAPSGQPAPPQAGAPAPVAPQAAGTPPLPPGVAAAPTRPFQNVQPTEQTAMRAMNMGLHGQAMLDALPARVRSSLEAIAFYDAPLTDFSMMGRGGMQRADALNWIRQINPSYDQNWYAVRGQGFKNFFTGTAPQSPNVLSRAYNTAIGHAGELAQDISILQKADPGIFDEARKSGTPFLSYLAANAQQKMARGTPVGEAWARINAVLPLYAAETARFYSGGPGSETERQAIEAPFNPNLSFRELMGALYQQKEMFKSKTAPLEKEYNDVINAPGVQEYGPSDSKAKAWTLARDDAVKAEGVINQLAKDAGVSMDGQPQGGSATPTIRPVDQQALDWAKANPNDPRAAQIKQRLGVQ